MRPEVAKCATRSSRLAGASGVTESVRNTKKVNPSKSSDPNSSCILGLYWGYIGVMENTMETAILGS